MNRSPLQRFAAACSGNRLFLHPQVVSTFALGVIALLSFALPATGHAQLVKWHPGHYIRVPGDTPAIGTAGGTHTIGGVDVTSTGFSGVIIRIPWNQLETSQGVYTAMDGTGTGTIKSYLSFLQPLGLHLIVELRERNYAASSTDNNDAAPSYLISGGYVVKGTNQSIWLPNYGDSFVKDSYIALLTAMASRFDGAPNFEGFQSGEQGTYGNGGSTWKENFTLIAEGGKKKFTHTMFWAPMMDPETNMDASQLTRILVTGKAGEYIIDSPPHEFVSPNHPDGWNQYAIDNPNEFPVKANGEVASWLTALTTPTGTDDVDPVSYYNAVVGQDQAHHIAWTTSATKLRSGWWTDVVSFVGAGTHPTNLRLPLSIAGNMVVNSGFENALDVEWTAPDAPSLTGLTQQSGAAQSGTYALRAVAAGSYGERAQAAIPVTAGTSYTITHSIRVDSLSGSGFSFKYDWFDSSGTIIGSTISQDQSATTSGYVTKTVIDTAPTGACTLRLRCAIRSSTTSGTAYFDDISVLANQVLNAGFELALGAEWSGDVSFTRQTSNVHSGTYSLKAVATGSYGERAQTNIPVNAGQTYTIGGYVRVDSLTGTGFSIRYDWLDNTGASIGNASLDQTSTTSSAYVQKTTTVTAPAGTAAVKMRCIIKSGTTAGTAYFDDINVY